jgi:malonyl-CoA O-methyltransferase
MSGARRLLHSAPPYLDRAAIRRHHDRASRHYDASAALAARLREEMIRRLDWVAFTPEAVLDLGCGTGHGAVALAARWPRARVIGLDASPGMLREASRLAPGPRIEWLRADAESLPLPNASCDLVFSNLLLPWCEDIDAVFAEVARVLRPRGLFTFTTAGPDTLGELRAAWSAAGGAPHEHPFTDMHDLGDGLVRAGLAEPVLDVSRYTLTYPDVRGLMRELKATGAQNAVSGRPRGLTGRQRIQRMEAAYEQFRSNGALPASVEAVFGQAWGATEAQRARRVGDEISVPLERIPRRR